MTDHPAWVVEKDRSTRRVVRAGDTLWSIIHWANESALDTQSVAGMGEQPSVDQFDPVCLPPTSDLFRILRNSGPVLRVRTPDLWEALATAIIRQVIRASQARKLYVMLSTEYGERVETGAGPVFLLPTPDVLLTLTDQQLVQIGLSFKRGALRAAAEAVLKHGDEWRNLSPEELLVAVQSVPRIGPWTAGAAVADYAGRFDLYPYADLAVRTWAKRIAPDSDWPDDEPAFAERWREIAGDHLGEVTALTLAWGSRT